MNGCLGKIPRAWHYWEGPTKWAGVCLCFTLGACGRALPAQGMCSDPPWPRGKLRAVNTGDLRCEGPGTRGTQWVHGESQGLRNPNPSWAPSGAWQRYTQDPVQCWDTAGAQDRVVRAKCNLSVASSQPSLNNPSTGLGIRGLQSAGGGGGGGEGR